MNFSASARRRPTALMGGSFNPAHGGHRSISLFMIDSLALDEMWWLVSPGNPLKSGARDMAPLTARVASAQKMARRARIRASAIEQLLNQGRGSTYSYHTIRALIRRYPKRQFIWVMGSDNLAQFHRWKDWRKIAQILPIAVIARPGYNRAALASPAMACLRRFVRPAGQSLSWTQWSAPALIFLRYRSDTRSATAIRMADPEWKNAFAGRTLRDPVSRHLIESTA